MDSNILIHLGGVFFGISSAKAWGHLVQEIVKAAFSAFLTSQILSLPSFGSLRLKKFFILISVLKNEYIMR